MTPEKRSALLMEQVNHIDEYHGPERRREDKIVELLRTHVATEELMFKAGDDRMAAIEQDLQPIKKMYWAVVGSASVGVALLAVLVYFYQGDRADFKAMQHILHEQGTAIKVLIQSHQELEKDMRRDHDRFEKEFDKLSGARK